MHLNPLTTKLIGYISFKPETTLHIGVGGWGVVREIIKINGEKTIIPNSSWKGVFRQIAENIAKKLNLKGLEKIAVESYIEKDEGVTYDIKDSRLLKDFTKTLRGEGNFFGYTQENLIEFLRHLDYGQAEIKALSEDTTEAKRALTNIIAMHCPIGRLFGNTTIAGKLRFLDTIISYTPHLKPGIGIDRSSNTVKEDQLYFLECASIDSSIPLRLIADNLEPKKTDSMLFGTILEYVEKLGLQIGARKSVGLGALKMIDAQFHLVELARDNGGCGLANPFKYGKKMTLQQLVGWLRYE